VAHARRKKLPQPITVTGPANFRLLGFRPVTLICAIKDEKTSRAPGRGAGGLLRKGGSPTLSGLARPLAQARPTAEDFGTSCPLFASQFAREAWPVWKPPRPATIALAAHSIWPAGLRLSLASQWHTVEDFFNSATSSPIAEFYCYEHQSPKDHPTTHPATQGSLAQSAHCMYAIPVIRINGMNRRPGELNHSATTTTIEHAVVNSFNGKVCPLGVVAEEYGMAGMQNRSMLNHTAADNKMNCLHRENPWTLQSAGNSPQLYGLSALRLLCFISLRYSSCTTTHLVLPHQ
jgi:hypothetical protein